MDCKFTKTVQTLYLADTATAVLQTVLKLTTLFSVIFSVLNKSAAKVLLNNYLYMKRRMLPLGVFTKGSNLSSKPST